LADDFVTAIAEDQEGSIWIGTRNGLSQLSDVKIPTFGRTEGLVADLVIDAEPAAKGGLWVASNEGVLRMSEEAYYHSASRSLSFFTNFIGDSFADSVHSYSTEAGLREKYVKRVFEARNGDVYMINGQMDVEVLSGGKVVARYPNQVRPTAITEDARSVIVSIGEELYRVGTNFFEPYAYKNDDKPALSWVFNMITARDGAIWIATSDGVWRVKDGTYSHWTKNEGLSETKAICVTEDADGTIWAGLESGIARIKDGQVRNITRNNGLFDNIIHSIVPDNQGSLWAASGRGFFQVSRQGMNDFADGKTDHVACTAYAGLDAVRSFERNQQEPVGCKTRDGRIWFPTSQGIVMIDPTNITINPVPPSVYVYTVRANGKEVNVATNAMVHPGKGELEFYYAGLSYIAPQKIQYRYKLDGYDKDWVEAGTRRSAFYTNLKPQKYQFQVRACNADGVWGSTGASVTVTLLPHYYQTTWFITLAAGAIMLVLLAIYGWRVRRLRWKQRKLEETHNLLEAKVKERTMALAESNTSLKSEIEERKRMEQEVERVHRQLVDASRMAGQAEVASSVLHNVGNVLNSVNVSTTLLSERLQRLRLTNLAKAADLIQQHVADLGRFFTADDRGRRLPEYLKEVASHLQAEQKDMMSELGNLAHNVEHIKEIVAMQQNYAKISGAEEKVEVSDLVESALKMHAGAYLRHSVKVEREFEKIPTVIVDRHKVLQILINVLQNAKLACDEGGKPEKKVFVRIKRLGEDRLTIEIADNGIGISPENLTRIFSHGFTTRKTGHGFGLHSSALAAKEMGGSLTARSEGIGNGASFVLELPIQSREPQLAEVPAGAGVAGNGGA
jgi:signal transduction histidine kinase